MDKLAGPDLLNDSDSEDEDYVPSGGEESDNAADQEADGQGGEIPEEDEQQKQKTESLWADFLADVGEQPPAKKAKTNEQDHLTSSTSTTTTSTTSTTSTATAKEPSPSSTAATDGQQTKDKEDFKPLASSPSATPTAAACKTTSADETPTPASAAGGSSEGDEGSSNNKIKVTQVFDFAGEKIEVEKELDKDSKEAKKILADQAKQKKAAATSSGEGAAKVLVRPKVGGGLSMVVGAVLNKKNKMGILEKSKLDWTGFKRTEGIAAELANHNKGKDGYLERMAFLERTDLRQFDREKAMRDKQRSSRGGT